MKINKVVSLLKKRAKKQKTGNKFYDEKLKVALQQFNSKPTKLIRIQTDIILNRTLFTNTYIEKLIFSGKIDLTNPRAVKKFIKQSVNKIETNPYLNEDLKNKLKHYSRVIQKTTNERINKLGQAYISKKPPHELNLFDNKNYAYKHWQNKLSDNVSLIKTIPSREFEGIEKIVANSAANGDTIEVTQAKLQKYYEDKKASVEPEFRAAFHAHDQVHKHMASLSQIRFEKLGVTKYIWSSSGDGKVRDRHAELDGQIFSYDDPPVVSEDDQPERRANAGEDYNCRCVAIPYIVDVTEG